MLSLSPKFFNFYNFSKIKNSKSDNHIYMTTDYPVCRAFGSLYKTKMLNEETADIDLSESFVMRPKC